MSDVIVPERFFVAGVRGKQQRKNERAESGSGRKRINIAHEVTVRTFDFTNAPLTVDDWAEFEGLHEITEGGAYGCLLRDPKDHVAEDWPVTLISGTTYQAVKRYTFTGSSTTKDRTIRRLHAASFVLKFNGVVQTLNSYYTFNANTGVITIASAPAASAITWSGVFYTPVHFQSDDIDWELIIAGPAANRYTAGQSIVLEEVME